MKKMLLLGAIALAAAFWTAGSAPALADEPAIRPGEGKTVFENRRRHWRGPRRGGHGGPFWFGAGYWGPRYHYPPPPPPRPVYIVPAQPRVIYVTPQYYGGTVMCR